MQMKPVTSPQNDTIKLIRSLSLKKHRAESGLFVAEGEKVLARARACGWRPVYLVTRDGKADGWAEETLLASEPVMRAVSRQENASSAVGVFRIPPPPAAGQAGLWLVLEGIRDPGNLGTIIRTADTVAAAGIILTGPCCDPWSPDSARATMGSIFAVPLLHMETPALVSFARTWPGEIVATAMDGAEDYRRNYAAPSLLLMGSEGNGLSAELAALAHVAVRIPMAGPVESLNVAIATALLLYEIKREDMR